MASRRPGLGSSPRPCYNKTLGKERHQLIQEAVRSGMVEARNSRTVGIYRGQRSEPHRIKFLIQSVYDVLRPIQPLLLGLGRGSTVPSQLLPQGARRRVLPQVPRPSAVCHPPAAGSPPENTQQPTRLPITFARAGSASVKQGGCRQLEIDLERWLKFPKNIAATTLRQDMVLVSC